MTELLYPTRDGRSVGTVPIAPGITTSNDGAPGASVPSGVPASRTVRPPRAVRARRAGYTSGMLALPVFHLRHLLQAGVPLADALADVATLEPGGPRRALWHDVGARVAAGASLSRAFEVYPADIDATALALVRAGEASGRLAALLDELEAHLRWRHELAARLRTVTLYPLFASVLLLGVVGFLIGYVVPSLATFLRHGGAALPWHGTLLLALADALARHGVALALGAGLPLAALVLAPAFGAGPHRLRDALVLRAGGIGRLVAMLSTARWARTTALLYGSGVELGEALAIAEGTLGNRALERELATARAALLAGRRLGPALADCPSLPPTLVRLVTAGESAGALEPALHHGASQLQLASRHAIARIEALVGPVLLCVSGGLLLWIALSVLSPLYESVTVVGLA